MQINVPVTLTAKFTCGVCGAVAEKVIGPLFPGMLLADILPPHDWSVDGQRRTCDVQHIARTLICPKHSVVIEVDGAELAWEFDENTRTLRSVLRDRPKPLTAPPAPCDTSA
jgi:hypothetical protein